MRNQSEILVDILKESSEDNKELRVESTKRLIAELLCIDATSDVRENNHSCVILMAR